jgi:transglutaminase-like putative cysteine protease
MRLFIRHETRYSYEVPPDYAVQLLHLTPVDFDTQRTVSWRIEAPGIERALGYRDGFGNQVHVVTFGTAGKHVAIVAEGAVDCEDAQGVVRGLPASPPDAVFLRQTAATLPNAGMRGLAEKSRGGPDDRLARLHEIMQAIHGRIAYEIGATHAHTTAAETFEDGRGVCQDHAHVFIGVARHLGIPSRYVTGYLVTDPGATASASHAWAEALVPGLGWVGFDPANGICPTERYVRVAGGIDAASVAPVRGTRRGGSEEAMTVAVSVQMSEQ